MYATPGNSLRTTGQLKSTVRKLLLERADFKCSMCGWGKKNQFTNTYPLDIDHIDGNSLNNNLENLRVLCPNCHSLTPTYKGANKKSSRLYRKKTTVRFGHGAPV